MSVVTVGLDLAKQVFQVHGVDEAGRVVIRRQLRRDAVEGFFGNCHLAWWEWRPVLRLIIGPGGYWPSVIGSG